MRPSGSAISSGLTAAGRASVLEPSELTSSASLGIKSEPLLLSSGSCFSPKRAESVLVFFFNLALGLQLLGEGFSAFCRAAAEGARAAVGYPSFSLRPSILFVILLMLF